MRDGGDDVDSGNTYYDNLLRGVAEGHCSMGDVDAALARSLKVRFELGLFDSSADQPLTRLTSSDVGTAAAARLNLRATAESLVLLKHARGPVSGSGGGGGGGGSGGGGGLGCLHRLLLRRLQLLQLLLG